MYKVVESIAHRRILLPRHFRERVAPMVCVLSVRLPLRLAREVEALVGPAALLALHVKLLEFRLALRD